MLFINLTIFISFFYLFTFLSLFYFVLHEETITYLGMGNQGQIFFKEREGQWAMYFLE